MARNIIKIGNKEFKYKKDALSHYKDILNSYDFGEILDDKHYYDIIDLLNYDITPIEHSLANEETEPDIQPLTDEETNDYIIENVRIAKVQYGTKCFELLYRNGETEIISYRLLITKPKENLFDDFRQAARNIIQKDINSVKQEYFDEFSKKGFVPCQETGIQSKWTELAVDHRQPNTFSVIVDRFIELYRIDLKSVEYKTDHNNFFLLKDNNLTEKFRNYHKEKANLRIVRKECNSSRSHQGRINEQKKDLKIK